MKKFLKVLALFSSVFLLAGCGEAINDDPNNGTTNPETLIKKFDKVIFEDATFEYDGKQHSILPTGMPEDTTIKYIGRSSFTEIGDYTIKVELSKVGYETEIFEAKLHITLPFIKGLSIVESKEIVYDGKDHINDIKIEGEVTSDMKVTGPILKKNGVQVKEAIEVGTYNVHYKIEQNDHQILHLYSELIIKGKEFNLVSLNKENINVPYDGLDHANDINVIKVLNPNAKVTKEITNEDGKVVQEVIENGTYKFRFVVQEENYNDMVLETTLTIYDSSNIKNIKNKLIVYTTDKTSPKNYNLMFMDLHNAGRLTSIDTKDSNPVIMLNEEILDYSIAGDVLYYKNTKNEIKYGFIGEYDFVPSMFYDQSANLDFFTVQNRMTFYSRYNEEKSLTEICRVEEEGTSTIIYEGKNISNFNVIQNKVYFLEEIGLFNKTISSFSAIDKQDPSLIQITKLGMEGVIDYKVSNKNIYFMINGGLAKKSIKYLPIYGDDLTIKDVGLINGDNIEFVINGDELIYSNKYLLSSSETGIYKKFLDVQTDDLKLLDTTNNDLNINSLTLFEEQLYFSNQKELDCHLYRIPSFGVSKEPILIK